jgi:multicomponent K+:H+ antiporter subunit E
MMRRLLPFPFLSFALFVVWLLLNNSLAPGQIVLAALLALALPVLLAGMRARPPRLRRPLVALRLALVVAWDIVVSSLQVALQVIGPRDRLASRFFELPLDIEEPHAIAALAAIISLTPGTVSVDIAADRSHLLLHGLHVPDAAEAVAAIKQHYEAPLGEIFA